MLSEWKYIWCLRLSNSLDAFIEYYGRVFERMMFEQRRMNCYAGESPTGLLGMNNFYKNEQQSKELIKQNSSKGDPVFT